ncbi:hypothetical protein [Streptomyces sp. NPDC049879]|uniref:hypothetical protein n=1 Tax=Streptomyces sp. NPDC049879 TaxID=3365598 RepID=UPI003789D894
MSNDAMRDGYFHGRVGEAPPMPARASALTFSLGGPKPLAGLAVQDPPLEVLATNGARMGPLELVELAGFVRLDADPAVALEAGVGWSVTCDARTGQTDVRTEKGKTMFTVVIPLLSSDEGAQWMARAAAQGALPVITGPGVTVDMVTGDVAMDDEQARWLFADFVAAK